MTARVYVNLLEGKGRIEKAQFTSTYHLSVKDFTFFSMFFLGVAVDQNEWNDR